MASLLELSSRADSPLNADTSDGGAQVQQPAFVTVQGLLSFSGASAVVTGAWKIVQGATESSWADSRLVPAVLCVLIGIFLFLKAVDGGQWNKLSFADKFGTILITIFNTAFLWAAACGIDVLGTAGPDTDSGTA
jgi:hypothetical protein